MEKKFTKMENFMLNIIIKLSVLKTQSKPLQIMHTDVRIVNLIKIV